MHYFDLQRDMNTKELLEPIYEIKSVENMRIWLLEYMDYVNHRSSVKGMPHLTSRQHRDNIQLWLGKGNDDDMACVWPLVVSAMKIIRGE